MNINKLNEDTFGEMSFLTPKEVCALTETNKAIRDVAKKQINFYLQDSLTKSSDISYVENGIKERIGKYLGGKISELKKEDGSLQLFQTVIVKEKKGDSSALMTAFEEALRTQNISMIEAIKEVILDPNIQIKSASLAKFLAIAIDAENTLIAEAILKSGKEISSYDLGDTFLEACKARSLKNTTIIETILNSTHLIDPGYLGCALVDAIRHGESGIAKLIIKSGREIGRDYFETAFNFAAARGYAFIVEAILNSGKGIDPEDLERVFFDVIEKGYILIPEVILKSGREIAPIKLQQALIVATEKGNTLLADMIRSVQRREG